MRPKAQERKTGTRFGEFYLWLPGKVDRPDMRPKTCRRGNQVIGLVNSTCGYLVEWAGQL